MINVQFSDTTKTEIIRMFGAPQDPAVYPNQGTVLDADPRYVTFITPPVVPNVTNCLQSLKVALGGIETVAAIKSFPAFMFAMNMSEWADVQTLLVTAKALGDITATQYTDFQTAFTANNIPVTLP